MVIVDRRFLTSEVLAALEPVFARIESEFQPLNGKTIAICPAAPEDLVFRLAARVGNGNVIGIAPERSRRKELEARLKKDRLEDRLTFKHRGVFLDTFPLRASTVDGFLYGLEAFWTDEADYAIWSPTDNCKALRPGGVYLELAINQKKPVPEQVLLAFDSLDVNPSFEPEIDPYLDSLRSAGLRDISMTDITDLFIPAWRLCRDHPRFEEDVQNFIWLLDDPSTRLGVAMDYVLIKGTKGP